MIWFIVLLSFILHWLPIVALVFGIAFLYKGMFLCSVAWFTMVLAIRAVEKSVIESFESS